MEYTFYNEYIIRTTDKREFPIRKVITALFFTILALTVTLSIIWTHWWIIVPGVVLSVVSCFFFWISGEEPWTPKYLTHRVDLPYSLRGHLKNAHKWNPTYINAVDTLWRLLLLEKDIDETEWAKAFSLMNKELAPLSAERKKRMLERPDIDAYVSEIRTFNNLMEASWTE